LISFSLHSGYFEGLSLLALQVALSPPLAQSQVQSYVEPPPLSVTALAVHVLHNHTGSLVKLHPLSSQHVPFIGSGFLKQRTVCQTVFA
jgi:hypothetical protein